MASSEKKKRKIGFYLLKIYDKNASVEAEFVKILNHLARLDRQDKKLNLDNNKFCLLDNSEIFPSKKFNILFKSAKHKFRPDLIDEVTLDERNNPKKYTEGDIEKTHIVAKVIGDEILLLIEKHINGLTINNFIRYLNHFRMSISQEYIKFGYEVLAKDDFIEELDKLARVTIASVYYDKEILGSEALNYHGPLISVKDEIELTVKSNRESSIVDYAKNLFIHFNGGSTNIKRIRIVGKNDENNEVVINTELMEKQEFILSKFNSETGELLTSHVFVEMNEILNNYH